ncbi:hypothetical protein BJ508DRAFT_52093 [Ascobolus immersus RN42]|uniref:Uncharacterized protein n=1 Tax=Ascobolus immersus RN42 TaxID=1160509 RepID=A0A3N4IQK0_ASCIM|nr:hypothetical protein BJ508DRAFT_52093 [Ascobolus immersus RN42]
MSGRRILHQRTASETNSSNNSRTSSLVSQRIKKFETIVSSSNGSSKSNSPKAPIKEGSSDEEKENSEKGNSEKENSEKENSTGNEKSDASSVHTNHTDGADTIASFGSLPPVPPLRINKLLPAIEPLKVHRQTQSQDSHNFDYSQASSSSRPGSYQQPIYRDSFQSQEPTTNAPHTPVTPQQLLSPFTPQAPASPSPSHESNSSLRPLLPLKPILKKPKEPLPPYSVEDYKQRRNSWVRSTFSNQSQRELQHMRSLRLVNEDMDEARIGSDISTPMSAHHSHSRYSSVSGTINSRPLSSRLSAGLQEWGSLRHSGSNSAMNSRSARSSSFGLHSNGSSTNVGPSFYPAWAR